MARPSSAHGSVLPGTGVLVLCVAILLGGCIAAAMRPLGASPVAAHRAAAGFR